MKETLTLEAPTDWEAIIHFTDFDTPPIAAGFLPGWAGEFVKQVSRCAQTPESFAVMLAHATISACIQRRVCVSPYGDEYVEPANVWTVAAMPPGSRKTFVQEQLTSPLIDFEREQAAAMKDDILKNEAARTIAQKRIEKLEKAAANESDGMQRMAIEREMVELRQTMPDEIRVPRFFTNDCTPERFQSLLAEHGERMAVLSDEGGIFDVISGLYSDGRYNLDVFLKSHAGSAVRVDRGSRTAYLNQPLSTFGLAVQPSVIEDLNRGSKRRFRGNGCLARFLYVVPPSNIGYRNMAQRFVISSDARERYATGIRSLLSIPPLMCNGVEQPRTLTLERKARLSWTAYSEALERRQGPTGDLNIIADWSAKLAGAALRLAAIHHVVEYGIDNGASQKAG